MASIDKRSDGVWRARWREYPGGPQRSRHFRRRIDAERWLTKVEHDKLTGSYVDPAASRITVAAYAATWLMRMRPTWAPSTFDIVSSSLVRHIVPTFGERPIGSVKRSDIEAWAASLPLQPSTVATVRQHLGQLLAAAVDDGLIPRNPAAGARLPRATDRRAQPVSAETVEAITAALPPWLRVVVPLGLGVGLRQGEACGLTVGQVDFLRRTLRVDRQLVTPAIGAPTFNDPKTSSSHRTVPLAGFVIEAIAAHLVEHDTGQDGVIVHTPDGRPIGRNRFGDRWRAATTTAGASGVRYHDLRHTFASTLLSQGVSVKAVADWLGHASPTVTLSTYAHLMPVDEDRARSVLDGVFAKAAEDSSRTNEGSAVT
jgi:integrase